VVYTFVVGVVRGTRFVTLLFALVEANKMLAGA
jgi:hypothetical protein